MTVASPGGACTDHLALLGARLVPAGPRDGGLVLQSPGEPPLACTMGWLGPDTAARPVTEPVVQALSGLMSLHGTARAPRRLGLDVASAAAALLASQAVLAALVGRRRGLDLRHVETSVLDGALAFLSHLLPIATCGAVLGADAELDGPGPPFVTAEGTWIELEVLRYDAWSAFWARLGVPDDGLDTAWSAFALRYLTGRCSLPVELHRATRQRTLTEVQAAADGFGIAVARLRTYREVLADAAHAEPWAFAPGSPQGAEHALAPDDGAGPLAGLRVVELATRLQGPLAGLQLRRLGADVVKVEPPGGDMGRAGSSAFGRAAYLAYNRGKEVVEINVKEAAGRTKLLELASTADVFVHNSRPGRAERLGFGFDDVARAAPGAVYCYASGWDASTVAPAEIAGDYLVQAHAGCGEGLRPPDEPPLPSPLTLVDVTGGLLACEGILAGLCLRESTRCGCRVGTSLFAAALQLQQPALDGLATGREIGRRNGRPLWGLLDRPLATADGFLVVAAEDPRSRRRVARVCGLAPEAGESRIAERLRRRAATVWERELLDAGVAAAVVRDDLRALPGDAIVGPRLEQLEGSAWAPAAPWRFAG